MGTCFFLLLLLLQFKLKTKINHLPLEEVDSLTHRATAAASEKWLCCQIAKWWRSDRSKRKDRDEFFVSFSPWLLKWVAPFRRRRTRLALRRRLFFYKLLPTGGMILGHKSCPLLSLRSSCHRSALGSKEEFLSSPVGEEEGAVNRSKSKFHTTTSNSNHAPKWIPPPPRAHRQDVIERSLEWTHSIVWAPTVTYWKKNCWNRIQSTSWNVVQRRVNCSWSKRIALLVAITLTHAHAALRY